MQAIHNLPNLSALCISTYAGALDIGMMDPEEGWRKKPQRTEPPGNPGTVQGNPPTKQRRLNRTNYPEDAGKWPQVRGFTEEVERLILARSVEIWVTQQKLDAIARVRDLVLDMYKPRGLADPFGVTRETDGRWVFETLMRHEAAISILRGSVKRLRQNMKSLSADEERQFDNIVHMLPTNQPTNKRRDDDEDIKQMLRAWDLAKTYKQEYEALLKERANMLAAVQHDGLALASASETLQADRDIVLAAVQQNGLALESAADTLKADGEVVLTAVQQSGLALKFADDGFKADRAIVLAAVQQNGLALKYAAPALKKDREVVLAAVQQNGHARQFAAMLLQIDYEVWSADFDQNGLPSPPPPGRLSPSGLHTPSPRSSPQSSPQSSPRSPAMAPPLQKVLNLSQVVDRNVDQVLQRIRDLAPLDAAPEHDRTTCLSRSTPSGDPSCVNQAVHELIKIASNPVHLSRQDVLWQPFF